MPLEKISIVKRNQVTPNDTVSTGALFVSNRADQDTLNFVAPMATYSIDSATIAAAKVKYILVADAQIMLDEGLVNVKRGGLFQPFHKGEIFVDRRSHFHRIYDADVSVVRGMDYKASGKYDYVDEDKNVETIFFQDVNVDKSKIETYAKATLTEPDTFKLSPHFDFVGSVDLRGQNHYLVFSGGVRPIHGTGNFRCVGNVVDAGFNNVNTGYVETLSELRLQLLIYILATSTQGDFGVLNFEVIVGVEAGQLAEGGIALHHHKVLVVVHVESGAVGILHFPHQHKANHGSPAPFTNNSSVVYQ